jgi:hypothetical protein
MMGEELEEKLPALEASAFPQKADASPASRAQDDNRVFWWIAELFAADEVVAGFAAAYDAELIFAHQNLGRARA